MCIQYEVCDIGALDVCGRDEHTELNFLAHQQLFPEAGGVLSALTLTSYQMSPQPLNCSPSSTE